MTELQLRLWCLWMCGAVRTWQWLMEAGLLAPTGAKTVDIVR